MFLNSQRNEIRISSVAKTIEIFRQAELFQDLDDNILQFLVDQSVEKRLGRNEILLLAGDEAAGLYVVAEGSLRAYRMGMDGREQVIHVENAVTTIAEVPVFDDGKYPSTVAAEEPSRVFLLPKNKVRAACLEHPKLALAAAKLIAGRLRRCAALVESLSLREVGQRLAQLLIAEAKAQGKRTERGIVFKQPLTHNQLAARIGTVREVVTRVLVRLQNQQLIEIDGKKITIPDLNLLAQYAETENS
jgi:CRP/FNR family transcriptional regulator